MRSQRGPEGGYWLAHPAEEVTLARSSAPSRARWSVCAASAPRRSSTAARPSRLQQVWIALRANLRKVLEHVTVADVAAGKLPKDVIALTREEEAWKLARGRWALGALGRGVLTPRRRAGAGRRTARIWPSLSSSSLRRLAGQLRPDLAAVGEHQLDADLEAECTTRRTIASSVFVVRVGDDLDVVRAHVARRRAG